MVPSLDTVELEAFYLILEYLNAADALALVQVNKNLYLSMDSYTIWPRITLQEYPEVMEHPNLLHCVTEYNYPFEPNHEERQNKKTTNGEQTSLILKAKNNNNISHKHGKEYTEIDIQNYINHWIRQRERIPYPVAFVYGGNWKQVLLDRNRKGRERSFTFEWDIDNYFHDSSRRFSREFHVEDYEFRAIADPMGNAVVLNHILSAELGS